MGYHATVWNEHIHEQEHESIAEIYPDGMHGAVADALREGDADVTVETATLHDEPDHGLTEDVLDQTDVLTWWGHTAHDEVKDDVAERVQQAVLDGMGLVVLHSGHKSKPFRRLMGTSGRLTWDEQGERERIWVTDPAHPVAEGLPESFEVEPVEMYGEFFDIPQPDSVVFTSWFEGGEVFRSGCAFHRGHGRIFYFRPGHETYPHYHDDTIRQVIRNACDWAAASGRSEPTDFGWAQRQEYDREIEED